MKVIDLKITTKNVIKAQAKKTLYSRWINVYQIPHTLFVLNECEFTADALFTQDGQFFDSAFMLKSLTDKDISIGGMYQ
jgi:hypothetical protein